MSIRAIGITYLDEPFAVPVKGLAKPVAPLPAPSRTVTPHPAAPTRVTNVRSRPPQTTVEIKFDLPRLPKLPSKTELLQRLPRLSRRRLLIGGSAVALVTVMAAGGVILNKLSTNRNNSAVISPLDLPKGTPKYATLLPAGKNIDQLGGWTRISPPDRNDVYAYTDKLDGIAISVSQQPLPDNFRGDTAKKVEELARSFRADQKLVVGSTEVFIGSSASGPQSVILTKDGVLVLIKSTARIDPQKWGTYVNSLQ